MAKLTAAEKKKLAQTAIDEGDLEALKDAFSKGLKLDQKLNGPGQTALNYAVARDRKEIIRYLLGEGADPNVLTVHKMNCLHFAKDVEVAKWLLEAGADPNQVSKRGEDINHFPKTFGDKELCQFYNRLLGQDVSAEDLKRVPAMVADEFWTVVERAYRKGKGDESYQARELFMTARRWPVEEILGFEKQFWLQSCRARTSDLWAAAFIIRGGCSDDAFADFQSWLVSLGRTALEKAIANPDSLVRHWNKRATYHNYTAYDVPRVADVARLAYESASGKTDFFAVLDYSNVMGAAENLGELELDWSEGDSEGLERRFPKLWKAFRT